MIITAKNTNVDVTPRKLRLLVAAIGDLKPQLAVEQLAYLNYAGAPALRRTIKQALSNATNNLKLNPDSLKFHSLVIDKGITRKSGRPGPRGRFKPYRKIRSHITIKLLSPEPEVKKDNQVKI